ncbi:hypothetical protein ACIQ4Z_23125 [Peribacillus asahii]|uniref:hypothetical protein n=1 Tax=Peribacillus asahii TaxID=228899 RepID=UPI00381AE5B2
MRTALKYTSEAEQELAVWPTFEEAQAFCADVKGRIAKYDYSSDELKIMPDAFPVIRRTEEEQNQSRLRNLFLKKRALPSYPL